MHKKGFILRGQDVETAQSSLAAPSIHLKEYEYQKILYT